MDSDNRIAVEIYRKSNVGTFAVQYYTPAGELEKTEKKPKDVISLRQHSDVEENGTQ